MIVNRKLPVELERIVFNLSGKVRHEKLHGRDHLVVPAVMMTEGVHNGSGGNGFYSEDALAESDDAWNHMPIVVYHPEDEAGNPKTARDFSVLESSKIGLVLNTKTKDKKQRFEAWLDYKLTKKVDKRILEAVENGEKVEVSTGVRVKKAKAKGKWGKESYSWKAVGITPDHLAVLPDQVGACSIEDGAGLLQLNRAHDDLSGGQKQALMRAVRGAVKQVGASLVKNALSFSEQSVRVSDALAAAYGEKGKYWRGYVAEVYPDYVIFCNNYSGEYYRVSYTVSKSGEVSLGDDKTEVVRTTEYKAVNNAAGKSEPVLNTGKATMKPDVKKKMVKAIVTNAKLSKETAEKLSDDEVRSLYHATKPKEPVVNTKVKVKRVEVPQKLTTKDLVKMLPKDMRMVLNRGKKAMEAERQGWIKTIKANPNNAFEDEFLNNADPDMLQGLAALAKSPDDEDDDGFGRGILKPDFSGAAGGRKQVNNAAEEDDEVLEYADDVDEDGELVSANNKKKEKTA